MENQIMSQHDLKKVDTTHLEFVQASKCDIHLKLIDFICITCEKQMCSNCAIDNHRNHDIQDLEKYVRIDQSEYFLKINTHNIVIMLQIMNEIIYV